MANLEKFKEKARKYELKEQWSKAIEEYAKAINLMEAGPEVPDAELPLYNRVGDLYQRVGDSQKAIQYYERAVDKYQEIGLANNAIALCNKVLRIAPGRSQVYLKLGMLFAARGFPAEAKTNLLEYADRMQKAGQLEEAFKALKKFAEMTAGQDDIWSVLAQQARASARTPEQKEQVEKLLVEFEAKERTAHHRKSRMSRHMITGEDLPPEQPTKKGDLIFLDLEPTPPPRKAAPPSAHPVATQPPPSEPEVEELQIEPTTLPGAEDAAELEGLRIEPTSLAPAGEPLSEVPPLEIESTFLAGAEPLEVEPPALEERAPDEPVERPAAEAEGSMEGEAGALELVEPEAEAADAAAAVEGLPMLDQELDAGSGAGAAVEEEAAAEEPASSAEDLDLAFLDVGEVAAPPSPEELEARIAADADDWEAHRLLAEALIESGERTRAFEEYDTALEGLEQAGELESAYGVAEEVLRLDPNSVHHHQKRVELAYRQGDRLRLAAAYLELADALLRSGEAEKAVAVYQRVLEHDPSNDRAKSAIETLSPPAEAEPELRKATPEAAAPPGGFVDLGAMLLDEDTPRRKDTRMRIEDEEPSGDEQKDFQTMLEAFKKGVLANVEEEDFQSHYDLGVAYKEMGLLDEAIAEFQKALRSADGRLKSSEALGLCFFEKGQFIVAETILRRALELPASGDAERVGLLYWLGRTQEELDKGPEALHSYNRVFAVDITFQDVRQRVRALSGAGA
jgi:tetratricopeptide (TPR) repeat protein